MSNTQNNLIKSTPRDFFLYLLAVITLYISIYDILVLLFQYVDLLLPNPGLNDVTADISASDFQWYLASLIVAFPIFLCTTYALAKDQQVYPEKNNLRVRKWLVYFTLFLSVLILMTSLMLLIFDLLRGDLVSRGLLKTLLLVLVIGSVFVYYLRDLKEPWPTKKLNIIFGISVIVVLAIIISGIILTNKSRVESMVIQKLIPQFAQQMGCKMGNNGTSKWNDHGVTKYSIAWAEKCKAPGIGDDGNGSTFVCDTKNNKICCWPLGFSAPMVCG